MKLISRSILITSILLLIGCNNVDVKVPSLETEISKEVIEESVFATKEVKNNAYEKNESPDIHSKSDEDAEINLIYKAMYKEKLKELVQQYGVLDYQQSGEMNTWEDKWFQNQGIFAYEILDFDSDGIDEMLVCYTAEPDITYGTNGDGKRVLLSMYEVIDDSVKEVDSMPFRGYHEEDLLNYEWTLPEELWKEEWLRVTIILNGNNQNYILCEGVSLSGLFADGYFNAVWLLEYDDQQFDYVCSLTQDGEGSDGMSYTGFSFNDGMEVKSEVLYSENKTDNAIYSDWSEALVEFLQQHGVEAKEVTSDSKGVGFEDNSNFIEVFEFSNRMVKYNSDTYGATFEAVMKSDSLKNYRLNKK